MKVNQEEFLDYLDSSRFGTGSVAEEAGVETSEVLALIAEGETDKDVICALEAVLGDWSGPSEGGITDYGYSKLTVAEVKELVEQGKLEGEKAAEMEKDRPEEDQRVTLLRWIEEELSE